MIVYASKNLSKCSFVLTSVVLPAYSEKAHYNKTPSHSFPWTAGYSCDMFSLSLTYKEDDGMHENFQNSSKCIIFDRNAKNVKMLLDSESWQANYCLTKFVTRCYAWKCISKCSPIISASGAALIFCRNLPKPVTMRRQSRRCRVVSYAAPGRAAAGYPTAAHRLGVSGQDRGWEEGGKGWYHVDIIFLSPNVLFEQNNNTLATLRPFYWLSPPMFTLLNFSTELWYR